MKPRLRVVVAPDSFKGSLSARAAARAIAVGVLDALPEARVTCIPMADGGEGTLEALAAAGGVPQQAVAAVDALGRPATARFAVSSDGRVGVVELASASGLTGVADVAPRPRDAHTRGTGQVAAAVLDAGVAEVIVCLGGSASTDGGAGVLTGLGARVLDDAGQPVPDGGEGLAAAAALDLTGLHPRAREVRWRLAVDVTNPLTGPRGAAAVFAPQKGAGPDDVAFLDAALNRWAELLDRYRLEQHSGATGIADLPGAGAAGGVPAALVAVLGATIEPGAALVAEAVGLPEALADADLVITGEGSFDAQSLHGKVPGGVARAAGVSPARPPVVVLAGQVRLTPEETRAAGIAAAFPIAPEAVPLATHLATAATSLRQTATEVASAWAEGGLGPSSGPAK